MPDWQEQLTTIIAGKNICLVGFGREGQSTLKLLEAVEPGKKIAVADAQSGPDYLKNLKDFDLIIQFGHSKWPFWK